MPKEIEEILSDKEVITKKILQMRTASLTGRAGAEVERRAREYIKAKELDIEPSNTNDAKLLNNEKQIEFETVIIDTADKMLKEMK